MARSTWFAATGAIFLGAAALVVSAPAPPDGPVTLRNEVAVKADGVVVDAFTLLPDGRAAILVGVKGKLDEENPVPDLSTDPAGAMIDLGKRAASPFVNGHTGPIRDLTRSADGRRVYTIGQGKDAVVRVWDAASGKTTVFADFTEEVKEKHQPSLCVVSGSDRVAVELDKGIAIVGAGGKGRVDLTHADFDKTAVSNPTTSPDGSVLVCRTVRGKILAWDMKSANLVAEVTVIPEGVDYLNWTLSDVAFLPGTTDLLMCRYTSESDVPEGKDEGKVVAERRAVWAVDLKKKAVRPLGLGHTIHTYRMAVHPGGRWLALVGVSRGEGEFKDKPGSVGEVRIYDLPTRTLALKRQYANFYPMWAEFSGDGRRLACASPEGEVRAWDFVAPVK